jgi:16S rRNA C1402 N4-methylase RsmH
MKNGGFEKDMETDVFGNKINQNPLHALKDVLPSDKETRENPRSRSARLRVAEKI